MDNGEFLTWLHQRLEHHYKVDPNTDWMIKLRGIAAHASEPQDTPELAYNRGYDAGWEAHKARTDEMKTHASESIVASCTCLTKTPEVKYHAKDCRYRLLMEAQQAQGSA